MSATTDEPHPLDESLGNIHEIALGLAYTGQYRWAEKLAAAHETIQQYVIEMETKMEMIKLPLPPWIVERCTECDGTDSKCDHSALRERLELFVRSRGEYIIYTSGELGVEDLLETHGLNKPYAFASAKEMYEQDKIVFLDPKDPDKETFDKLTYYKITIEEVPCPE